MDRRYLVRVSCMTYNQAHYIVDAMNGFTMQETNFPFVCTILDDASTDGEQEVIRKYLEENFDLQDKSIVRNEETDDYILSFARHKTNMNCYFAVLFLKYNHYSIKKSKMPYIAEWHDNAKYIAFCEGDDYWIDSKKLQKQVDFLEHNLDFIVCTHRFFIKDERGNKYSDLAEYDDHNRLLYTNERGVYGFVFDLNNYWDFWYTQPLTMVFRNGEYLDKIPRDKYKYYRDVITNYYLLKHGKGMLLKDQMGVYRKNNGGIFAGNSLIANARITNDNLRTIYEVEGDEGVLPVLHNNVITLWRDALSHLRLKESFLVLKQHYNIVPQKEIWPFTLRLLKEPFMILSRKLRRNNKIKTR